jgi:molybdopterin-binding protein
MHLCSKIVYVTTRITLRTAGSMSVKVGDDMFGVIRQTNVE